MTEQLWRNDSQNNYSCLCRKFGCRQRKVCLSYNTLFNSKLFLFSRVIQKYTFIGLLEKGLLNRFNNLLIWRQEEDLPRPHITIIGSTGAGKSSLANVFIGESPLCSDCTFPICNEGSSCTKETTYAVRPWLGSGPVFTVVDTPGSKFSPVENKDPH